MRQLLKFHSYGSGKSSFCRQMEELEQRYKEIEINLLFPCEVTCTGIPECSGIDDPWEQLQNNCTLNNSK